MSKRGSLTCINNQREFELPVVTSVFLKKPYSFQRENGAVIFVFSERVSSEQDLSSITCEDIFLKMEKRRVMFISQHEDLRACFYSSSEPDFSAFFDSRENLFSNGKARPWSCDKTHVAAGPVEKNEATAPLDSQKLTDGMITFVTLKSLSSRHANHVTSSQTKGDNHLFYPYNVFICIMFYKMVVSSKKGIREIVYSRCCVFTDMCKMPELPFKIKDGNVWAILVIVLCKRISPKYAVS